MYHTGQVCQTWLEDIVSPAEQNWVDDTTAAECSEDLVAAEKQNW